LLRFSHFLIKQNPHYKWSIFWMLDIFRRLLLIHEIIMQKRLASSFNLASKMKVEKIYIPKVSHAKRKERRQLQRKCIFTPLWCHFLSISQLTEAAKKKKLKMSERWEVSKQHTNSVSFSISSTPANNDWRELKWLLTRFMWKTRFFFSSSWRSTWVTFD
jgi:hypothetical protein